LAAAALLICAAGLARAQGQKPEGDAAPRRPSIYVKPFEDVALWGKELVEQGKLGADTTVDASATAQRTADGGLRPESVKVEWHDAPDETVAALAHQLLRAFSESRVLSALEGVKGVRLALKLDRQDVSVQVACEMPSEAEATKYEQGYGLLATAARISRKGTDEGRLFEGLRFSSEGKMFKMSFEMPRAEAARMIADALAKRAAK
jgi:hypothetical protein